MHVAIIGAGLAGLTTAFSLQRAGCRVTVVDREAGPALETSFANGGLLTPSMPQPWNEPGVHRTLLRSIGRSDSPVLFRLRALPSIGRWGIAFLRESRPAQYARNIRSNFQLGRYSLNVLDELYVPALPAGFVQRTGWLKIFRSEPELNADVAAAEALKAEGLVYEVLAPAACVEREPLLAAIERRLSGGLWFPDDRSGDARRFCTALAAAIGTAGGELRYRTTIKGWRQEHGRVRGAQSNAGEIRADAFVIAAGSHSRELARRLDFDVLIYPVKGYSLSLPGERLPALPHVPVVDSSLHAVVATLDGSLRIAGTAEFAGFDTRIRAARIRNLESLLRKVYPDLARRLPEVPAAPWAGLRPMSADGVPFIGRTPVANVYLNAGHGHLGWTLSPGSGELLAALITGAPPGIDPAPYAVERFSRRSPGEA